MRQDRTAGGWRRTSRSGSGGGFDAATRAAAYSAIARSEKLTCGRAFVSEFPNLACRRVRRRLPTGLDAAKHTRSYPLIT